MIAPPYTPFRPERYQNLETPLAELEFFPMARNDFFTARAAMDDFFHTEIYLSNYSGAVFLIGPPHIYQEQLHFATRWGWRHWVAMPV